MTCEALVGTLVKVVEAKLDGGALRREQDNDRIIQFGKSKVLLKQQAFEVLELMVGSMKRNCATVINAWIRRYLCRVAFISVQGSLREELRLAGSSFEEWFRDHRELYYQLRDKTSGSVPNIVRQRRLMFLKSASVKGSKECEKTSVHSSQSAPQGPAVRANHSPRNPTWIIVQGLWTRNPSYEHQQSTE
jgi:myosin heavy subunit